MQNSHKQCCIRTRQSYETCLAAIETTGKNQHGIKFRCPIKSNFFHPIENFAADIHHDLFEGVVPYILKLLLQVCNCTMYIYIYIYVNFSLTFISFNRIL